MKTIVNSSIKNWFYAIVSSLIVLVLAGACKTKFYNQEASTPAATQGSVDLSSYVSVGTNITAGYADSALYTEAQSYAYPNLIAQAIQQADPSLKFVQPDINSANGWEYTSGANNWGRLIMETPACTTVAINGIHQATINNSVAPYVGDHSLLTNLAVPFLTIDKINTPLTTTSTSSTNPYPYYERIVSTGSQGIASEAKKRNAKFFTVWLGYLDVLSYATSGGTKATISTATFQSNLQALLDSLTSVPGSKGVIANIPYVYLFPKVTNNTRRLTSTTDPAKLPIYLTKAQADSFNTAIKVPGLFAENATSNYAFTPLNGPVRQLTNPNTDLSTVQDYIVTSSILDNIGLGEIDPNAVRYCGGKTGARNGEGFITPIPSANVLDVDEINTLNAEIDSWNSIINSLAASFGGRVAVVDMNTFYTTLTKPAYGIPYGSLTVRANHPSLGPDFGGFYSLDRTFPTPRGQALLANEFIKVINSTWGATLGLLNPGNYRENTIP